MRKFAINVPAASSSLSAAVALVKRNSATLRHFELAAVQQTYQWPHQHPSSPDLAFALSACANLQTLRARFPLDFFLSGDEPNALVELFAANCKKLECIRLSPVPEATMTKCLKAGQTSLSLIAK